MTNLKTLSAVIILGAAVATPAFAQDAETLAPKTTHHVRVHAKNYRGAYNQVNEPAYVAPKTAARDPFGYDGTEEYPRLLYSGN
ncbi:hypothetical protein [Bradyrhizobium sp. dw_411]|uniref:hypothetical protein n=1 Tax=Bradyrhizobium sp. dw_411 TaxID=2720082 RepID=UPI001BCB7D8F|nr:hypothetical protein [Bradyrhizobium sp. dw_411]